jgi:hypothetical protein
MPSYCCFKYPWEVLQAASSDPVGPAEWSPNAVIKIPRGGHIHPESRKIQVLQMQQETGYYTVSVPQNGGDFGLSISNITKAERENITFSGPPFLRGLDTGSSFRDTQHYQTVISWSSFFDDCSDENAESKSPLTWDRINQMIKTASEEKNEPQMALIVKIAQELSKTISDFAYGIRKVLSCERRLTPIEKAEEFDAVCIDWYIRQPGLTAHEKAAYNQQKLKSVVRKDYVDTLENRVLKDFLKRCVAEANLYRNSCTEKQLNSARAKKVRAYSILCSALLQNPIFQEVSDITCAVQPNYVLQGDARYKLIWKRYLQLLRKQRANDLLWAWQSRTWSDIVALFLNVAFLQLCESHCTGFTISPLARCAPIFYFEQKEGRRLDSGSHSGPYIIKNSQNKAFVLETFALESLEDYIKASSRKDLSILRECLADGAFVITPLSGGKVSVIPIWGIHSALDPTRAEAVWQSAHKSLLSFKMSLEHKLHTFHPLIILSSQNNQEQTILRKGGISLLSFKPGIQNWSTNIAHLMTEIDFVIGEIVR